MLVTFMIGSPSTVDLCVVNLHYCILHIPISCTLLVCYEHFYLYFFFFVFFFFFSSRRRHTRSLCDWSSDVCSSDLLKPLLGRRRHRHDLQRLQGRHRDFLPQARGEGRWLPRRSARAMQLRAASEIGRASCRERV